MDMITPSVLQQICIHNVHDKLITSDAFVDFVFKTLQRKNVCKTKTSIHDYSQNCNERLNILSAIQACFEYSADKGTSSNDTICDQSDGVEKNKASDRSKIKEDKQLGAEAVGDWFKQTNLKLVNNHIVFELLSLQETIHCLFASHIINKIIRSCVAQYKQITEVLKYIENNWKRTNNISVRELELIKMFTLKQSGAERDFAREQVSVWFVYEIPMSLKSDFVQKLKENKHASFQEDILFLSVLKKVIKYFLSSRKEIPTCISKIILDILDSHKDTFFTTVRLKDKMGRIVFSQFLKVLSTCIHIDFCFKKVDCSEILLETCCKMLQYFSSIFEACELNGYMKPVTFWGTRDFHPDTDHCDDSENQLSSNYNLVVVREMFFLAVKAFTVLSLAGHDWRKGNAIQSIVDVCQCVLAWLRKHFDSSKHLSPGWIPFLLGDQDDKWIATLLCLLIIYQNSYDESSDLSVSNECDENYPVACDKLPLETKESVPSCSYGHQSLSFNSTSIDKQCITKCDTPLNIICPHRLFLQFVQFICFDHLVFSDFLMSPETYFLEYLTKYLRYLEKNWDGFVLVCNDLKTEQLSPSKSNLHSMKDVSLSNSDKQCFTEAVSSIQCKSGTKRLRHENMKAAHQMKSQKMEGSIGPLVSYAESDSSDDEMRNNCSSPVHSKRSDSIDEEESKRNRNSVIDRDSEPFPKPASMVCRENCEDQIELGRGGNGLLKKKLALSENYTFDQKGSSKSPLIGVEKASAVCSENESEDGAVCSENESEDGAVCSENESQDGVVCSENGSQDGVVCSENESEDGMETEKSVESDDGSCVEDVFERTMTMLIRLRLHIERLNNQELIPYKADLFLKLLSLCEDKYENSI